eukprot:3659026-Pyramimonas_sp.AAC.1
MAGYAMMMPVHLSRTTSADLSPFLSAASSLAKTTRSAVSASPNFFGAKASWAMSSSVGAAGGCGLRCRMRGAFCAMLREQTSQSGCFGL